MGGKEGGRGGGGEGGGEGVTDWGTEGVWEVVRGGKEGGSGGGEGGEEEVTEDGRDGRFDESIIGFSCFFRLPLLEISCRLGLHLSLCGSVLPSRCIELSRLAREVTGDALIELTGRLEWTSVADSSSGPMYWGREDEECVGDRADGDGDFLAALLSRICFNLFVKVAVEDWTPAGGEMSVPLNGTTDINGWCCAGADID